MSERADIVALLPGRLRIMFAVIEKATAFGSSVRISELDLRASGIGPRTTKQIGLLMDLGLLEVSIGAQHRRTFHLSNNWRRLDAATAREVIEARGLKVSREGKLP
jgi:hypothetical protein